MRSNSEIRELWLLILLSGIVLLVTAGIYPPMETSDARYLDIAREMYISGDYIHPNLLHIHHYHKPPVTYQITALGYELFGLNEFGGRFFLQLSILFQIYLVYRLALLLFDNSRIALYSSYIYISFIVVLSASRSLTTDSFLSLFELLAIIFWLLYDRDRSRSIYLYSSALSLALGFLTKGPVVFIIPFIFIAIYRYYFKNVDRGWRREHLFALLLFLIVGGSWYLYLIYEEPSLFDYFTIRQTVDRFATKVFHRDEPFYYYFLLIPLLGLPWLGLLPYLIKRVELKDIERVLLFTSIAVLIFFSLSHSKRVLYILPLMPILAILVGDLLSKIDDSDRFIKRFVVGYITIIFLAILLAPISSKISMPWWIYLLIIFITAPIFRFTDTIKGLIVASVITNLTLLAFFSILAKYNPTVVHSDSKILAEWIEREHLKDRAIIVYDKRLPSLEFILDRDTISLYKKSKDLNRETQFERDSIYKRYFYNLNIESDRERLREFIRNHKYIIISHRNSIHKDNSWLINGLKRVRVANKWDIYY